MKRILMVGDANHYFNRKLTEQLKSCSNDLQIDFFSIKGLSHPNSEYPYDDIFDCSVLRSQVPYIFRIRGAFGLYASYIFRNKFLSILKSSKYDVIHLQSANHWISDIIAKSLFTEKLVVTIWGSDFYRASRYRLKKMSPIFSRADKITFATEKVSEDFNEVYSTLVKHEIVKFGLGIFDKIDKSNLPIRKNYKITVTVGYNRHHAQQHLEILKSLESLKVLTRNKIRIVLPFTYGPIDNEYKEKIIQLLYRLKVEYEFLNEFMNEDEVAEQCLKSDIMIQVQKTDAFSGSMQEYMYAGNVVITGSWLPYQELNKKGVFFVTVDEVTDISKQLEYIVTNYSTIKTRCSLNKEILKNISSWEGNLHKWKGLYS